MTLTNRRDVVKGLSASSAPLVGKAPLAAGMPLWLSACSTLSADPPALTSYPKLATSNHLGFLGHLENGVESVYEPQIDGPSWWRSESPYRRSPDRTH